MMHIFKWIFALLLLISFHSFCLGQDKIPVERCHQFLKGVPVNCMQSDDVNMMWVGTNLGLYIFNYFEGVRTILEEGAVTALAEDDQGFMWCSLATGEIVRADKKHRFKIGDGHTEIKSMKIKGSHVWIGTASGGVHVWNINTFNEVAHYHQSNSKLPSDEVNFVHKDDENTLWIGTKEGLSRVSGDDWSTIFESKDITAVADYDNQLWFAGQGYLWTKGEQKDFEMVKVSRQLIRGEVIGMSFDDNGRLYMASEIFSRYDSEERNTFIYDSKFGFNEKNFLCVGKDENGDMWVGTDANGLFRFKIFFEEAPKQLLFATIKSEKVLDCPGDADGVVIVEPKGGLGPYTYNWSCNGCSGNKISGLSKGKYEVTITDSEGTEITESVLVEGSMPITIEVQKLKSISREGARDGEIVIKASGGKGRLTYTWSDNRKTPMRRALKQGEYEVTVSDERGCELEKKFVITEPRLIPELEPTTIEEGQIIIIEQLFFDADSLGFTKSSIPALDELSSFLINNPTISIEIGGHTNGLPNHDYCNWLSNGRAKKVADYFYSLGIKESQLSYKGYGKRNPIASNDTKIGRGRNQRVEIKIIQVK